MSGDEILDRVAWIVFVGGILSIASFIIMAGIALMKWAGVF